MHGHTNIKIYLYNLQGLNMGSRVMKET